MKVYIFSSTSTSHVTIALEKRLWAIAPPKTARFQANLAGKAAKLSVGELGIFYVSNLGRQEFTVPFTVVTSPKDEPVERIWPGVWHFPFQIKPLGDPHPERGISWDYAKTHWRAFQTERNPQSHLSGRFAFMPTAMETDDWNAIIEELCTVDGRKKTISAGAPKV